MKDAVSGDKGKTALPQSLPLLHEMLRSFVVLAATLNLSEAVRLTGATRQTLRRHIATLESMRGEVLFTLDDRRYVLTDAGRRALDGAQDILTRGDAWLANVTGHIEGLVHISATSEFGVEYHLQHHPMGKLWESGERLLQVAFKLWAQGMGRIEAPELQAVRPYFVVFRKVNQNWVCVEVGEQSSYATWYGLDLAKSSIGLVTDDLPAGSGVARLLMAPFEEVLSSQTVRLDHIVTEMIRDRSGPAIPTAYQRLLLGIEFPNGSHGIVSVVERTYAIEVLGITEERIRQMPPELVMNSL